MSIAAEAPTAAAFDWKLFPEADGLIAARVDAAIAGNAFAAGLSRRMAVEASTRFADWVDHLVLSERPGLARSLTEVGFRRRPAPAGTKSPIFDHHGGMFPMVVLAPSDGAEVRAVGLKVESIADFSRAHDLGLDAVGPPMGPYRSAEIPGGPTTLVAVERRGYRGLEPYPSELAKAGRMTPQSARDALAAKEILAGRRRRFDDDAEGFDALEHAVSRALELAGSPDLACHLFFEVERDYWQSRNRAARAQRARQDRLGLGWANHDHHTFRSSRRFFPRLMGVLESLGFAYREHFHAGAQAGWGAQILEQEAAGIVVFADLDLTPEEIDADFAREALPDLARPNTVGLWVGLHGESILGAGMHHLEAQFDFDALRADLKAEAGVDTMTPFSDFPFLRQAFTAGERWAVDRVRANRLLGSGAITAEQHARFLAEGALGSHLENLQRRDGYKGFNQKAVSVIIAATDPRLDHGGH